MNYVLITAGGIALCSLAGAVIGFLFEDIPPAVEDAVSGCAAGIMLCAAVLGLVVPSMNFSGSNAAWMPALGIFCGAVFLSIINRGGPKLAGRLGMEKGDADSRSRALAFVAAIAIHHFPEGIAAGVSFGTGDISDAVTVVSGIAFQNIPESMIIIPPLLKNGTGKKRAAAVAVFSGAVEVLGVFFGYFAITLSTAILPFALAFAAGTMLFVIVDDMVPQTHLRSSGRLSTYMLLLGFCLMLAITFFFE
ncbi:MAG: ZIP family metal transporter [Bacillota bacterium]|nr:ZIP family metal transporter [Bacillota bacterium]